MYASELAKFRYSRSTWIVGVIAAIGVVMTSGLTVFADTIADGIMSVDGASHALTEQLVVIGFDQAPMQWATLSISGGSGSTVGITSLALMILGVLSVTSEFRHGSMATTLLASPNRLRALWTRAAAVATVAAAISILLVVLTTGVFAAGLAVHGVGLALSIGAMLANWAIQIGAQIAAALIGMGVGLIVRSQVPALVIVFAWVFVEAIVRSIAALLSTGTSPADFLPLGLSAGTNHHADILGNTVTALTPAIALIVLLAWTVCIVGAGGLTLKRRDVPA